MLKNLVLYPFYLILGLGSFSTTIWLIFFFSLLIFLLFIFIRKKTNPPPPNYAEHCDTPYRKLRFIHVPYRGLWAKKMMNIITRLTFALVPMSRNIIMSKHQIKGYNGKPIKVKIYQLKDSPNNSPCILCFHGGGFWMAANPLHKWTYKKYIQGTKAKLVLVDYTLSIHAPYPAAAEDCYATTLWVKNQAQNLGIDANKIALYGDSAGGALTAAVAQMLRDRKQFAPCFHSMIYPVTDHRLESESAKKYTGVPMWNTPMSEDAFAIYLKGVEGKIPSYAFPLHADDFSNLPPAYIETAEFDSLLDDGLAYAKALQQAGNEVQLNQIKGNVHAFELVYYAPKTKGAIKSRIDAFNRHF